MAFSDPLKSVSTDILDVADLFDAIVHGKTDQVHQSALQSTTSVTSVDISGMSLPITTVAGEKVRLSFWGNFSHDTLNSVNRITIVRNAADIKNVEWEARTTDVDGKDEFIYFSWIVTPIVGADTYKMQWRTTTGTLYMREGVLTAEVFRDS